MSRHNKRPTIQDDEDLEAMELTRAPTSTDSGGENLTDPVPQRERPDAYTIADDDDGDLDPLVEHAAARLLSHTPNEIEILDDDGLKPAEPTRTLMLQIVPALTIAGLGLFFAGLVLDKVQHWGVFTEVDELWILVPALLGLKGNLEMTLASRLSTASNLGLLREFSTAWPLILSNMALVQVQATVVSLAACVYALIFGFFLHGTVYGMHFFVMVGSALATASLASLALASLMSLIVFVAPKYGIDPDNIATPIAASLGDMVTIIILGTIGQFNYDQWAVGTEGASIACIIIVLFALPFWFLIARRHERVAPILLDGWSPVLAACMISSLAGIILAHQINFYTGLAVLVPIFNGLGGNVGAIQGSRMSTALHVGHGRDRPADYMRTSLLLFSTIMPLHLIFLILIKIFGAGHTTISFLFVFMYLVAASTQVVLLLYCARRLSFYFYSTGKDPDNFVLPYVCALGDLLGTSLLCLGFSILWHTGGDYDSDVGVTTLPPVDQIPPS